MIPVIDNPAHPASMRAPMRTTMHTMPSRLKALLLFSFIILFVTCRVVFFVRYKEEVANRDHDEHCDVEVIQCFLVQLGENEGKNQRKQCEHNSRNAASPDAVQNLFVALEDGSAIQPCREIGKDEKTDGECRAHDEVGDRNIQDSLVCQLVLDGCCAPSADEQEDSRRFSGANAAYRTAKKEFYQAMGVFGASQELFMGILPPVVIAVGGYLIMKGKMNYIDLITFTLFVSSFVTPIRKMAQFAEIFASGMAGLRRFCDLMALEPTVVEKPGAVELHVSKGTVDIDDVSFSYAGHSEVLHHVDLHVRSGEMIAVVGESGGGKTTLCQLIPRFYDVTEGSIRIDGTDIRDVTKNSLRSSVGIVQQEVFIFADTIRENIRYGRPDATDEEVILAAREAEIYEDIMQMPDGFDTYVGERGTRLSGGQRQRISIARIFLKNPAILILDEATSALDTITEERIQHSFDSLMENRTSFVIAHRLSTVRNADRIIVIENGNVVEEGTHAQLLALNGEYAQLYEAQEL